MTTLNTKNISVSELDFEYIKESLKTFMRGQSEYTDFDFEGSGINILLDILAYNTSMDAFMASMVGNESFIDSAQLRQAVVSLAKQIGYTPRSTRASMAIIDITIPNIVDSPDSILIPSGTRFTNSSGILFSTIEDSALYPIDSTTYKASGVEIYEGSMVSFDYLVDVDDVNQKFVIPSISADMTTLSVTVKDSASSPTVTIFSKSDDINVLNSLSEKYFLQENLNGFYEVYFGDGILGKPVANGNVVILSYLVSTKQDDTANKISTFSAREKINDYDTNTYTIATVQSSYGGSVRQDIEEIRSTAPKMYQAQNRAVIKEDYEAFMATEYPWIDSISVWGGEDNVPPVYGKIFLSIKPSHAEVVSENIKEAIKNNLIKNYNVVTVIPEIIDPDYLYVGVETAVIFNKLKTTNTDAIISGLISTKINEYFNETTKKFSRDFYYSPLISRIDNSDASIISSLTAIKLQLRMFPTVGMLNTYTASFSNNIKPNTVRSTLFNNSSQSINDSASAQYIIDNGAGILVTMNAARTKQIQSNVGTIDYVTGDLVLTLYPYELPTDTMDIRFNAEPVSNNITSGNNQIILPDNTIVDAIKKRESGIKVTTTPLR